jgi:hypothetical protein
MRLDLLLYPGCDTNIDLASGPPEIEPPAFGRRAWSSASSPNKAHTRWAVGRIRPENLATCC